MVAATATSALVLHNTLLVLPEVDDVAVNPFRKLVLDFLSRKKTLKKAEIMAEATRVLGGEVPTSVYNKVLKELCVVKGGEWSMRTGNEQ